MAALDFKAKPKMGLPVMYDELQPWQRMMVREQYTLLQKGLCYHCKKSLDKEAARDKVINRNLFPSGFFAHPIHLHHSHDTGLTLGSVHNYCNAVLWQYYGE